MSEPAASFEDHLAREIIQSERTRMAILAGLLGVLIVFFGLLFALFRDEYLQIFNRPRAFNYAGAMLALLLCYELGVRHLPDHFRWPDLQRSPQSLIAAVGAIVV